jgi:SAM-dependent methyltransferase
MKLEPTGERMIVDHYQSSLEDHVIYLVHMATYRFAETYTRGKRVLDFGCGSGYGSARIAESAAHVTAVDVAPDAVEFARSRFQRDNLSYQAIDPAAPLPFEDDAFDVVLSFQVLEHVRDTAHYLSEVRRVLAPGGRFVLVTPDRSTRLLAFQRPWNRYHVHEYSGEGLKRTVSRHFDDLQVMEMSGTREMIDVELRRCARTKWLTLPFTVPFLPDALRVAALGLLHRLRPAKHRHDEPRAFPFTINDVHIGAGASPSLNLVAIAS